MGQQPPSHADPGPRLEAVATEHLHALLARADEARRQGAHAQGAELAGRAAGAAGEAGLDAVAARALGLLALHRVRLGQVELAVVAARQALAHHETAPDPVGEAKVHNVLALAYESAGLAGQALSHANVALALARAADDRQAECGALIRLGTASEDPGTDGDDPGLAYGAQALALARQLGSADDILAAQTNRVHRLMARADRLTDTGRDAQALLQAALQDATEALAWARQGEQRFARAVAHCNLAGVRRRLGERDAATREFELALALAREHGFEGLTHTVELAQAAMAVEFDPGPQTIRALADELGREGVRPDLALVLRARRSLVRACQRLGDLEAALAHLESLQVLELRHRSARADLQARLLVNQAERDRALHRAERARLEGEVQRARADAQQRSAERLEQLVAERTAELQQAKDRAEAASRAKSAFLANISHELRTPLNGLLGVAELMLRRATDPHQAQTLRMGVAAGWRLRDAIADILELTALESAQVPPDPQLFDPVALLQHVAATMTAAAQARGHELRVVVPDGPMAQVLADAARVRQVLQIYVGNAIKFATPGVLELRLHSRARTGVGQVPVFEVQDAGPGIDEAAQERLFQAFSPGDTSSTRRHDGLGLGLALARLLAESMGGRSGVELAPGQGSCFWLQLPLRPVPAPS